MLFLFYTYSFYTDMSLETVFKNLYCFLEVLQNSKSEQVANWDKQSLNYAFKWAAYAEQVERCHLSLSIDWVSLCWMGMNIGYRELWIKL